MFHRIPRGRHAVVAAALLLVPAFEAASQLSVAPLRSGRKELNAQTTRAFVQQARQSRRPVRGLAFLRRPPAASDRQQLAGMGITLVGRLTRYVYHVRAEPTTRFGDTVVTNRIPFFSTLTARDRVAPEIWQAKYSTFAGRKGGQLTNYVVNRDGTLRLLVRFHEDVNPADATRLLRGLVKRQRAAGPRYWEVTLSPSRVRTLAASDMIRWIDAIRPSGGLDINNVRDQVHVSDIQGFDAANGVATGLTGRGIRIGVYDSGIDNLNSDFRTDGTNRIVADRDGAHSHGTFTAGILAGNGSLSAKTDSWALPNGGTDYQYRGIAPTAELIDAQKIDRDWGWAAASLRSHIVDHSMDLSNHSYWVQFDGSYGDLSALHDDLIRGDDAGDGAKVPPRLHVHSAGNSGKKPDASDSGAHQRGFFSLGNQLKNALVVGNYYYDGPRISKSSSLGPAHDGRIKPDVVAPGEFVRSTGYCDPPDILKFIAAYGEVEEKIACANMPAGKVMPRRNFYVPQSGTSVAAPVVTGILALVLEEMVASLELDLNTKPPLPSTLRAIAIHSATDQNDPQPWFTNSEGLDVYAFRGPDFASGYGLVNAAAAVDVVRSGLFREGSIEATCRQTNYTIWVEEGTPQLKVTVAWDDPGNDVEIEFAQPLLINDLDLVLIDPLGTKHYPWLLDQQPLDSSLSNFPVESQSCGLPVVVKRSIVPTNQPKWVADGSSQNKDDGIVQANLVAAGTGKDHINNVEQVVVDAPIKGKWTATVSGYEVEPDYAPQSFSIVGVELLQLVGFNPLGSCVKWPLLCNLQLFTICSRYPELCRKPHYISIIGDSLYAKFSNASDRKVAPLSRLCLAAAKQLACESAISRARGEIVFGPGADHLGVELFDSAGTRLVSQMTNATEKRIRIPPVSGELFLILSPLAGSRSAVSFAVPIRFQP